MKFRRSGKAPDKLKLLALLLPLLITLGGCQPQVSSSVDPPSSVTTELPDISYSSISESSQTSQVSSSTTDNTHVPETSEPPFTSDNSSDTDSSESVDSEESSTSEYTSESVSESYETSEISDTPSSEPVSTSSSSEEPPASSSSSSSEPEPPPVVVIPDVITPTSPGTQTAMGQSGAVDYSNAAQGYVSARYTGSSPKVKLRISANGGEYNHDVDPNGATEYYPLSFGSGSYTVTLFEQIPSTGRYAQVAQALFDVSLNSELSPFLCPNRYVNYGQSSDAVYRAAELCAGKTSAIDKIAAVFTWVSENISYDYNLAATVTTGYVPYPDSTLSKRTGICFDYASLMAAMLRSQSVPTRLVIGNASPDIYHAWNEVYTEETGWITPELMLKNAGYNIVDATFYSSSPNKAQIAEYISNGANYAVRYYY